MQPYQEWAVMKLLPKFGGKIKIMLKIRRILTMTVGTLFLWSCSSNTKKTNEKPTGIDHVVVIGVDGLSSDGVLKGETPLLDSLMQNGAYTLYARPVLPSSSSPNWASMIMGADTEQHGVTSNGWEKFDHQLPPIVATDGGTFPTIFTLFKDQRPETQAGAIYDWDGFGRLFEKSDVDFDIDGDHEDGTTKEAVAYIKEHKSDFTFIHLDHVDHAGHAMGHGSPEYYESVHKADSLIAAIVKSTKDAGIFNSTMFLICADHGGIGFGHGGESPAEMTVPFMLYGAGIKKGYKIEETVYQYDNAATVAYAMGLRMPQSWIGRPVKGAFIGNEKPLLIYKRKEVMTKPKILPDAGYFEPGGGIFKADSVEVVIQNPNSKGKVRYTLDGSTPTFENTQEYVAPFYVKRTTLIKTAVFNDKNIESTITEGSFRLVPTAKEAPVTYRAYHVDKIEVLPDFTNLKPVKKGTAMEFSPKGLLGEQFEAEQVAVVFESYLAIENEGSYKFFTNSDDGSKLYVDGNLVADNDGDHGVRERSGKIKLKKGKHLVRVDYFNGGGGYHLDVKYEGQEIPKQIIPANKLYLKK